AVWCCGGGRPGAFPPPRTAGLFFPDGAPPPAGGPRRCAEGRKSRFKDFRAAWAAGRSDGVDFRPPTAGEMDRVLHSERLLPGGGKRTYQAALSSLPAGVIVEHGGNPHLIRAGKLRPWSFAGYG